MKKYFLYCDDLVSSANNQALIDLLNEFPPKFK